MSVKLELMRDSQTYNAGMMLDEQLDQEMHSKFLVTPPPLTFVLTHIKMP